MNNSLNVDPDERHNRRVPPDVPVEICVFTKSAAKAGDATLTKWITLLDNGELHSDGSRCGMATGSVQRLKLGFPREFAGYIGALQSNEAIGLGRLLDGLPDLCEVMTKSQLARLNGTAAPDMVSRSANYFAYKAGELALMLIDVDVKKMSPAARERMDALGGPMKALASLVPALGSVAAVVRKSTSSGVSRTDTGEVFADAGGLHIYVPLFIQDAGTVKAFLDRLDARAWLAGLGWGMIDVVGKFHKRSLVDPSVALPERLVFEANAQLGGLLTQDLVQRTPMVVDGDGGTLVLDDCPELTEAEQDTLRGLLAAERARLIPQAEMAEAGYVEVRTREIRTRKPNMTAAEILRTALSEIKGKLLAESLLVFDNGPGGQAVSVADVLDDPARYVGRPLADPLEGRTYGRATAMLLRNADGHLWVKSHAHGGCGYDLPADPVEVETVQIATPAVQAIQAGCYVQPEIRLEPGALTETVNAGEAALIAAKLDVYQRGPFIVRQGSMRIAVSGGREVSVSSIMRMGDWALTETMTAAAAWKRYDARSQKWVATDAPQNVVKAYRDRAGRWGLPVLAGIVNAPTLRADGSILAEPGYDEATCLLLDFRGVAFPAVPSHPSRDDALAAMEVLADLISTFPFVAEADRSVALSCLLTGAVRVPSPPCPCTPTPRPRPGPAKACWSTSQA